MATSIASPEDAAEYGLIVSEKSLKRASTRVRAYTKRALDTEPSEELIELICTIAARLETLNPSLTEGVQSASAGGESVTFGFDSHKGSTSLVYEEKAALDRMFPYIPRLIVQGY